MAGWAKWLRSSGNQWLTKVHFLLRNLLVAMALYVLVRFLMHLAGLFSTGDGWSPTETIYPAKQLPPIVPPISSVVDDVRSGLVHALDNHLMHNDTALVLFYAPWCVHSSSVAESLAEVADRLRGEVAIYAMDCWEPGGSCRWENPGLIFPQVVALHRHLYGKLTYHGPLSVGALELFGRRLLRPMVYLTSETQLQGLLVREEVLAVGHFDFSNPATSPEFLQFYHASLLSLQTDSQTGSFLAPTFAVVTSRELGVSLGLQAPPSMTLLSLQGGRQVYSGRFHHRLLYQWTVTSKSAMEVTRWLVPVGNLSHLLSHPVVLLFLPDHQINVTGALIEEYRAAAIAHKRAELMSEVCSDLGHLKHTACLGEHVPHPQTFPPCSRYPDHLCPKYGPFSVRSKTMNECFCQDASGDGSIATGWPPPCDLVRFQFYLVDSDRYWSLANNMGLRGDPNDSQFPLIVADLRNRLQFMFSIDFNTSQADFTENFSSVLTGGAPLLYRSTSPGSALSCQKQQHPAIPCIMELSAATFGSAVLTSPLSVLVVHYTRWCAACTSVWPKMHSLAYHYRNVPNLLLAKMDGDSNDLPWCHSPRIFPSISLYPVGRKQMPVWFPFEWEVTTHLLIQFIANHTGIMLNDVGPELGKDGHRFHENGAVREWEDRGWSLWQIAENEKRAVQQENQELVQRINQLERIVKEARSGTDHAMESFLSQVEEAMPKMMHNDHRSAGREQVEEKGGDVVALAHQDCPATDNEHCTENGYPEQHQPDCGMITQSPIRTG